MFHSAHIQVPTRHWHRRRTGLNTFFPSSSFSPPDSRETMRKGVGFCSVAVILLLVGSILTWMEYNNMFGGKISMTGPLFITLAGLMMLLSWRQFRLAKKRDTTANTSGSIQLDSMNIGGVTALVIDHEDGLGTTAVVLEREEGDPEAESHRPLGDAAPPSYGDATYLDCSSTCPSFVSHDDHNEMPPTYEETCGIFIYGSETSLGPSASRRCSKAESSPKAQPNSNLNPNSNPRRSSNTLSPSSALLINPGNRPALLNTKHSGRDSSNKEGSYSSSVSISSEETVTIVDSTPISLPDQLTDSEGSKRTDWSRRSYSSIPSYTCLLSESGEVSSHVFNPAFIISQMNPQTEAEQGTSDLPSSCAAVPPTRSQSASSINKLRQGVPYDLSLTTKQDKVKSQPGSLSSSTHCVDSPTRRRSEGSRPNMGENVVDDSQMCGIHLRSDSGICYVHSTQLCSTSMPVIQRSSSGDSHSGENNLSDTLCIPSISQPSHDLLTQDIQETI